MTAADLAFSTLSFMYDRPLVSMYELVLIILTYCFMVFYYVIPSHCNVEHKRGCINDLVFLVIILLLEIANFGTITVFRMV